MKLRSVYLFVALWAVACAEYAQGLNHVVASDHHVGARDRRQTTACSALVLSTTQSASMTHNCTLQARYKTCVINCKPGFAGTAVTRTCTLSGTLLQWATTTSFPTCTGTEAASKCRH